MKKIFVMMVAVLAVSVASAQVKFGVKAGMDFSNATVTVKDASPSIGLGYRTGFYAGATMNVPFSAKWGLQTELIYNNSGAKASIGKDLLGSIVGMVAGGEPRAEGDEIALPDFKASVTTHVLRLPILVKYQINDAISVAFGPYIGVNLGYGVSLNKDGKNFINEGLGGGDDVVSPVLDMAKTVLKDNLHKFEAGLALGAEYSFCNGIFIDARYNWNLTNSLKQDIKFDGDVVADLKEVGITPRLKYHSIQVGIGYRF